ncbi:MAG: tetratricopeptide repeat protein [Phycisphaeraceae bacterium]
MHRHSHRRHRAIAIPSLLTASLLIVLAGCQNTQHDESMNAADNRWLALRSNMMLKMAEQQFETGDLDTARQTINDALQIDPENDRLYVIAGRIALEEDQLERAFRHFNDAQEFNENNPESHYYQGIILQRWQRYEDAEQAYRRAYDAQSDEPAYLMALSEMMIERGRADEALTMLEEKLDYFDQNSALRAQVGYLYKLKGEPAKAVGFFQQAALMNPDDPKLQEELAMAQLDAGEHEQAIATLESLLDDRDMRARRDLRRTLARAYQTIGRTDKARQTYLELARSPHGKPSDWLRLGELAWQAEDLGATLQAANRVIELAPQRYEGYFMAGLVWHKRGRLDDALTMFDRAADRAADRSEPFIMRGLSLQRAGRTAAARDAYQQALQRNPDDPRAQRLLNQLDTVAQ